MRWLKFKRMALGMTQVDVAREAHISQGHYSDIESGRTRPHPKVCKQVAEAIHVTPEEFVSRIYGVDLREMSSR